MDLALELGMTEGTLKRSMTEAELRGWQAYAARRMLPSRRMELYLAQLAQLIHACMGGAKDKRLSDYLFDPVEPAEALGDDDFDLADIAEFFGAEIVHEE